MQPATYYAARELGSRSTEIEILSRPMFYAHDYKAPLGEWTVEF